MELFIPNCIPGFKMELSSVIKLKLKCYLLMQLLSCKLKIRFFRDGHGFLSNNKKLTHFKCIQYHFYSMNFFK